MQGRNQCRGSDHDRTCFIRYGSQRFEYLDPRTKLRYRKMAGKEEQGLWKLCDESDWAEWRLVLEQDVSGDEAPRLV